MEKFTALETFESIIDTDNRIIEVWLIKPRFLISRFPYAENEDYRDILRDMNSLSTIREAFEAHKYLL